MCVCARARVCVCVCVCVSNIVIWFVIFINKEFSISDRAYADLSLHRANVESTALGDCQFLTNVFIRPRIPHMEDTLLYIVV